MYIDNFVLDKNYFKYISHLDHLPVLLSFPSRHRAAGTYEKRHLHKVKIEISAFTCITFSIFSFILVLNSEIRRFQYSRACLF